MDFFKDLNRPSDEDFDNIFIFMFAWSVAAFSNAMTSIQRSHQAQFPDNTWCLATYLYTCAVETANILATTMSCILALYSCPITLSPSVIVLLEHGQLFLTSLSALLYASVSICKMVMETRAGFETIFNRNQRSLAAKIVIGMVLLLLAAYGRLTMSALNDEGGPKAVSRELSFLMEVETKDDSHRESMSTDSHYITLVVLFVSFTCQLFFLSRKPRGFPPPQDDQQSGQPGSNSSTDRKRSKRKDPVSCNMREAALIGLAEAAIIGFEMEWQFMYDSLNAYKFRVAAATIAVGFLSSEGIRVTIRTAFDAVEEY